MKRTKILICGATGFIGRNTVEYFSESDDYEVIAVYNVRPPFEYKNVRWVQANLTDPDAVKRILGDIDVVVQAAATTSGSKDIVNRPHIHVTDNALMNSIIFRAAHEVGVKHILFFSCTVMYQSSKKLLAEADFDANIDIHPRYFGVGWTKVYIEKMCEFYSRLGETKYTAIRHSNIYGPHDKYDLDRSHVFGATISKVMQAKDEIVVWGSGEEARDLLYITDLMFFLDKAIKNQKEPFSLFNVGYGKAIKIKDLVALIVKESKKSLSIRHDLSQPTIPTSLALNCGKAEQELGWVKSTTLEDGIRKTLKWYKANITKS